MANDESRDAAESAASRPYTTVTVPRSLHARALALRRRVRALGDRVPAIVRARIEQATTRADGRERGVQGLAVLIDTAFDLLEAVIDSAETTTTTTTTAALPPPEPEKAGA